VCTCAEGFEVSGFVEGRGRTAEEVARDAGGSVLAKIGNIASNNTVRPSIEQ
jgi:hypothetical protein